MLRCDALEVSYGRVDVLRGLDLAVGEAELVAVLGPNGSGKSTTLKAIAGIAPVRGGAVIYDGDDLTRLPVGERVRRGITLVPQGRRLFGGMTVDENLRLGAFMKRHDPEAVEESVERWCEFFPVLGDRRSARASELSGGEQQMVAVARGLMAQPRMLLLDEPSLGIAPLLANELAAMLPTLRDEFGITIVLVEQNVSLALSVADRVAILKNGRVAIEDEPARFEDRRELAEVFFT